MITWPGWLGRLSPARRRLHLALIGVVVAGLVVLGVRSTGIGSDDPTSVVPVDQAERGPVLLVPGYGGTGSSLQDLAATLPDAEVIEPPGDGTGDLRATARVLADRVDEVLDETGAPSVDLVGYSAGGLVVRYYVAELGGASHVRRVVTIASPHHGTDVAALATSLGGGSCTEGCRQLDPASDLLRELNRGDETPDGPRWLSLWTDTDQTVVPPDSAVLDGATSLSLQEACGAGALSHGEIIHDPRTASLVDGFLSRPDPGTFSGTC